MNINEKVRMKCRGKSTAEIILLCIVLYLAEIRAWELSGAFGKTFREEQDFVRDVHI